MKKYLYLLLILGISACKPQSELEKKKDELAAYKAQLEEIKTNIEALEKEIALLDTARQERKPKLVKLQTIVSSEFKHFIDVQGTVDSEENIAVQPGMPGIVTKVNVKVGDKVSVGQVLAETDARALRENVAQLQTNLDLAKTAFEKQERLWNQKIGSEIQYLQAKTQYESLQKSLAAAQAQLDMSRIKSPINGVVDMVNIKVGEYAAPGPGVFRVVNFDKMKVVMKVADSYIKHIKMGAPVTIYLKDLNDTINGKVSFISNVVNAMNRTFQVEVAIGSLNGKNVRPNMLANVSINDENLPEAITITANLIQRDASGQTYVYLAEGGKDNLVARKQPVTTGLSYGDKVVIASGLHAEDRIITTGHQEVVDGQPIITL